jgi:hypothetical protein
VSSAVVSVLARGHSIAKTHHHDARHGTFQ